MLHVLRLMSSDSWYRLIFSVETVFSNVDQENVDEGEQEDANIAEEEEPAVRSGQTRGEGLFEWTLCQLWTAGVVREEWKILALELRVVSEGEEAVGGDDASNTNKEHEDERVDLVVGLEEASNLVSSL